MSGVATNDFDYDGESDIYEYALGGNPTNGSVQGIVPPITYHPGDDVRFQYLEVNSSNAGINYLAEWSENLFSNFWNGSWDWSTNAVSGTPGYDEAERRIYGGTNDNLYFRLKVSQP
ncbi:hypothetical protein [Pontiella sulfatireligans]|uniref:Uncharacterized protein n=1 Tax=Pontiella sulfatireligans TaxID=2750658 RepID=A0A6C2UEK3_9BACT|nr:hypothetical protein [Pontiella sulfatireligans]VGO18585.1 hypothetical protein SCARR_00638 [Pontiella sulfatireligans]